MIQQLKNSAPTYGWESPAVRAALENKGWLWVSINRGAVCVKGWYPPRIARYILIHLREAGSVPASDEWAHRVLVCGPGQEVGYFKYYRGNSILGLLGGLTCYHRKLNRQLRREVKRSAYRAWDASLLLVLTGHKMGPGGKIVPHKV